MSIIRRNGRLSAFKCCNNDGWRVDSWPQKSWESVRWSVKSWAGDRADDHIAIASWVYRLGSGSPPGQTTNIITLSHNLWPHDGWMVSAVQTRIMSTRCIIKYDLSWILDNTVEKSLGWCWCHPWAGWCWWPDWDAETQLELVTIMILSWHTHPHIVLHSDTSQHK